MTGPVLEIDNLSVEFATSGAGGLLRAAPRFRALSDISLSLAPGEVLGLIGESGSGKTTLGRAIAGLIAPTGGSIRTGQTVMRAASRIDRKALAQRVQMVFQDPYSSLHPRKTVGDSLAEPFRIQNAPPRGERDSMVRALLERVGLGPEHAARYPMQFSGGQRQRIAIARALANRPALLVADEPVSALDVSVQAQILNLLDDLRRSDNMAMLFISHDLSVVRHLCQRVAVMYLGRIVETGPARSLCAAPRHPYTAALLSAVPQVHARPDARPRPITLKGDIPSHAAVPRGCPFHTRCWLYEKKGRPECCRTKTPRLSVPAEGRQSACFFPAEVAAGA